MDGQKGQDIFQFFDGTKAVYCDPMEVYRRFVRELDGAPDAVLADAAIRVPDKGADGKEPDPGEIAALTLRRMGAEERLVRAARAAFGLPPVNRETGGGVTEDTCLTALYAWLDWMDSKKKPSDSPPTSPPPTAPAPSPSPTVNKLASG